MEEREIFDSTYLSHFILLVNVEDSRIAVS